MDSTQNNNDFSTHLNSVAMHFALDLFDYLVCSLPSLCISPLRCVYILFVSAALWFLLMGGSVAMI